MEPLIERYYQEKIKGMTAVSSKKKYEMRLRIHNHLINRVALNYKIMRIKQKLGYSSFLKNQTWTELWLRQILKSYHVLSETGQIKKIEIH